MYKHKVKDMGIYEWKKKFAEEKTIVIYGAGIVGKRFYRWLRSNNISNEVVFAVTYPKESNYLGVPIIRAEFIARDYPDAIIVVATKEKFKYGIFEFLNKLQIKNYLEVSEEDWKTINSELLVNLEEYDEIKKRIELENRLMPRTLLKFEVHITEHCNLNCRGCFCCSPLAEPEFMSVVEYEKDLARLAELFCGEMSSITIMGGEPLLHPELIEFFRITRKYFNVGRIILVTNGILLSNIDEEFWVAAQKYRVDIIPTKYPIKVDYDEIRKKAQQYGIYYDHFEMLVDENNNKVLENWQFDLEGKQSVEENFRNCHRGNLCIELRHGRMYTCSLCAHMYHFKEYFEVDQMQISDRNSIDIYKAKSAEEISEFLTHPIPACRYCKVVNNKKFVPFSVSKKCIEEWL